MTNSRPHSSRGKQSRRARRIADTTRSAGATPAVQARDSARVYGAPARNASAAATAPRRSYLSEPAPVDYSSEYRFIRRDLIRIAVWASLLIAIMLVLWFLPVL